MKGMNLQSCYVDKNDFVVRPKAKPHNFEPDKLRQQFKQSKPNAVWVSDFTYYKVRDHFYYTCVIIDLYSRKVIAHEVSSEMNATFVVSAFAKPFSKGVAHRIYCFTAIRAYSIKRLHL